MKEIFKPLDPYGFKQNVINKDEAIPKGWTDIFPPQPCFKPFFDGNKWKDLATESEIDNLLSGQELTELEILINENIELKNNQEIQNRAIAELGNIIAELAGD